MLTTFSRLSIICLPGAALARETLVEKKKRKEKNAKKKGEVRDLRGDGLAGFLIS